MHKKFFIKTDFDLSPNAKRFLLTNINKYFSTQFSHDLVGDSVCSAFINTPFNKELSIFLKKYNCSNYRIQLFLSNKQDQEQINPHVDVDHRFNQLREIKTRFNILLIGNVDDPYSWWPDYKFDDARLEHQIFQYGKSRYTSLAVPGDSPDERLKYLGPSPITVNRVLTPSAFVRTNCVHSVLISAGPRAVLTVLLDKDLDDIYGLNDTSSNNSYSNSINI